MTISLNSTYTFRRSSGRFIKRGDEASAVLLSRDIKATAVGQAERAILGLKRSNISVGYSNGIHQKSGLSYAFLASIMEFGTRDGRIPARPYLRISSRIMTSLMSSRIESELRSMVLSKRKLSKPLIRQRLQPIADDMARRTQSIILKRLAFVANNADATIARKGFDKPWVDTGELVSRLQGFVRAV